MPTFDWSNLLKGIVRRGIGFGAYNPITLFLAFAASLASVAAGAYGVINAFFGSLPTLIQFDLRSVVVDSDTSGILNLVLYLTCAKDFIGLIDVIFNMINVLVVWIPTFFVSLLAIILVFRFSHTVRRTLLDYCS